MGGGRPQRHVEHNDAIHNNERGDYHDKNEVPGEPGVCDITASSGPQSHRAVGPLTSQTHLTGCGVRPPSAQLSSAASLLWGCTCVSPPFSLLPPVTAMKWIPSSLETLLWVYHLHSSTEVR